VIKNLKDKTKRIIFVSIEPGGTNALVPVIKKLIDDAGFSVTVFAADFAEKIYSKHKIPCINPVISSNDKFRIKDAEEILKKEHPLLVVAGTSLSNIDRYFIVAAKNAHIPTMTVADQWFYYTERFLIKDKNIDCYPDTLCVMDENAKNEAVEEGFEPDRIDVTGNPYFDDIFILKGSFNNKKVFEFKRSLGVREDEFLITFASEPMENSEDDIYEVRNEWGYSEKTVVSELLSALKNISARRNIKICLIIKLHPLEIKSNFDRIKNNFHSEHIRIIISYDAEPRKLILSSDLVVGMSSIFLIESVLLGKLVLSLQPEKKKPDFLVTNRYKASIGVFHKKDIETTIEKMIFNKKFQEEIFEKGKSFRIDGYATDNVINKINDLL